MLVLVLKDLQYPEWIWADEQIQESNDTIRMNGNSGSTSAALCFVGLFFLMGRKKPPNFKYVMLGTN